MAIKIRRVNYDSVCKPPWHSGDCNGFVIRLHLNASVRVRQGALKIYIMLQLKLIEILGFYDIPQIILAKDKNNIKYIGVLQSNGQDYLFVKIENQDLEQLKCGEIDLLSVLTNKSNYFIAKLKSRSSKILSGKEISINKINTSMLPDSGFYLK